MGSHFFLATEYRHLPNGKYKGVVVQCLVGRFSTDGFELCCAKERNTKEEAVADAKMLAQDNGWHAKSR